MMWSPAVLAGIASRVGFADDELAAAVAVALTTSGGDDRYRWRTGSPTQVDARGLWGVDVIARPEWRAYDLWNPAINAAAAHSLYTAAGGSWSWSPVFPAGITRETWETATEAASRPAEGATFAETLAVAHGRPALPVSSGHTSLRDELRAERDRAHEQLRG
jgi:hypothetical protein